MGFPFRASKKASLVQREEIAARSLCEITALVVTIGRALRGRPIVQNSCLSAGKITDQRLTLPEKPALPKNRKRREERETAFARVADVLATEFGVSMLIAGSRNQP